MRTLRARLSALLCSWRAARRPMRPWPQLARCWATEQVGRASRVDTSRLLGSTMAFLGCSHPAGLGVSAQLLHAEPGLNFPAALAFMCPLLAACWAGVAFADRLEGFTQLRHVFKTTLIPQLRILPFWVRAGAARSQMQGHGLKASLAAPPAHSPPHATAAGPGAAGAGGGRGRGDFVPSLPASSAMRCHRGCGARPAADGRDGCRPGCFQRGVWLPPRPHPHLLPVCNRRRRIVWWVSLLWMRRHMRSRRQVGVAVAVASPGRPCLPLAPPGIEFLIYGLPTAATTHWICELQRGGAEDQTRGGQSGVL